MTKIESLARLIAPLVIAIPISVSAAVSQAPQKVQGILNIEPPGLSEPTNPELKEACGYQLELLLEEFKDKVLNQLNYQILRTPISHNFRMVPHDMIENGYSIYSTIGFKD